MLDILGYILIGLFSIFGIITLIFGAVAVLGIFGALAGAIVQDLRSLSQLFRR